MIRLHVHNWSRDIRNKDLIRRGAAIEQAFADQRLEAEWRARVLQNIERRERQARVRVPEFLKLPALVRRQAC